MKRFGICTLTLLGMFALVMAATRWSDSSVAADLGPNGSGKVEIDLTGVHPIYANYSRVTGTPEELIVDFALNPQPMGAPKEPLHAEARVVMNFYTAKRFAAALQMSIDRYEKAFGPIETDVEKRVKPKQ